MPIPKAPSKPDDPSLERYFYLCQTPGCGSVINELFPIGQKNPSPKWCKLCQNPVTRKEIIAEHERINEAKKPKESVLV